MITMFVKLVKHILVQSSNPFGALTFALDIVNKKLLLLGFGYVFGWKGRKDAYFDYRGLDPNKRRGICDV